MPRAAVLLLSALSTVAGCDSAPKASKANEAEEKKAAEEADLKARLAKRAQDREAKAAAEKKAEEDLKAKIKAVAVIPEGTKLPKKVGKACDALIEAQSGFMAKFHPEVPENALATQLGMIKKQCNEMQKIAVATCQKFALEATTEELKGKINDYLPACLDKYGGE